MNAISVSLLVFAFMFTGALIGMAIRSVLPRHDLNPDSKEVVKLAMSLIATLTALVLGLLVATAKSTFDAKSTQVRQLTSNFVLLDAFLEQYGPETRAARTQLRRVLPAMADRIWTEDNESTPVLPAFQKTAEGEAYLRDLQAINPRNEVQRGLRDRALQITNEIALARLQLHAQTGNSIRTAFLVVLVFWLVVLFAGFGLVGRASPVTIGALIVCALSVSGAIFLILELDRAFDGLMAMSSEPLRNALAPLR